MRRSFVVTGVGGALFALVALIACSGSDGAPGAAGANGTGAQGPAGANGTNGAKGDKGDQGAQGPQGDAAPLPPAPGTLAITTIAPQVGSTVGRELVTITGTGFEASTQFSFGGIAAEVASVSATSAQVYTPANPGSWGTAVTVTAHRTTDGASASNSNAAMSTSAFKFYASSLSFTLSGGPFNPQNLNNARVPLVGDVNNDGKVDLISTYISNGNHNVFLNSGGGAFVNTSNNGNPPSNLGTQKGVLADLDGDGNLDMAIADESGTWQYNLGNGLGTMISRGQAFYQVCSGENAPTAFKLSSAMYPDVAIVCTNNNQVRIWSTQAAAANPNALFGANNSAASVTLNAAGSPTHLMATDLNKDGKTDLVVVAQGNGAATLSWFINAGTTLPTTATNTVGTNAANQAPYWGKCGDLNGDGYPDCVVSDINTNTVRIFMNDGMGTLLAPRAMGGTVSVGQEPRQVNLVDLNGDGILDLLVAARQQNSFQVIPGKGDGTFGTQVAADGRILAAATTVVASNCRFGWSAEAADFDGDGRSDVVMSCDQNGRGEAAFGGYYMFKNVSR